MPGPLERIASDFEQFRRSVNDCRSADASRPEVWRNAYSAMARLRDRYCHEREHLTPAQRAPLQKVFEENKFIESMMGVRQVSEHVVKRGDPIGRLLVWTSQKVEMEVLASAGEMFAGGIVTLRDAKGGQQRIDHLQDLDEAEKQIKKAMDNAKAAIL